MRKAIILLVTLSISFFSFTQLLIPYKKGNLWGYSNTRGKIVIEPKYDKVALFDNVGGKVWKDNLMGYINSNGQELVELNYSVIEPITDSLFKVQKGGKWQIIDIYGESLFQLQFDYILILQDYQTDLTNNLRCKVGNSDKYGLVNINLRTKKGAAITPIEYDRIYTNSKLCLKHIVDTSYFRIYIDKKVGIIKLEGNRYKSIVDPVFKEIYFDWRGKIYCRTDKKESIFDVEGNFISERNLEKTDFEEYVLDAELDFNEQYNTRYPQYHIIEKNSKYGYIIIDRVKVNNQWTTEVDTIPVIYDTIIKYHVRKHKNNPYFIVKEKNKWGAVKSNGARIIPTLFDEINVFSTKIDSTKFQIHSYSFIVRIGDKWGVYGSENKNGHKKIPIKYDNIGLSMRGKYYVVKLKNSVGIISASDYKVVLKPKYAKISSITKVYKGFTLFAVKPTKDADEVYVGENGVEYFK